MPFVGPPAFLVWAMGLSRPNLSLDHTDLGWPSCLRWFEVELQSLLHIGEGLFLGFTLAGNVEFQALGDVPRPLAPDRRGEWSIHDLIVSQARNPRTLTDHRLPPSS